MSSNASYKASLNPKSAINLRSTSLCEALDDLNVYTRVISTSSVAFFSHGYLKCPPVFNNYIVLCVESNIQCTGCCLSSLLSSLGIGCMYGDCPTGYTCVTALCSSYKLLCESGSYSVGQNQCRDCANSKPLEATFLPGSTSATCPWYCNAGYFKSGPTSCQRCSNFIPRFGSYKRSDSTNCSWVCNSGYVIENNGIELGTVCKVIASSSKLRVESHRILILLTCTAGLCRRRRPTGAPRLAQSQVRLLQEVRCGLPAAHSHGLRDKLPGVQRQLQRAPRSVPPLEPPVMVSPGLPACPRREACDPLVEADAPPPLNRR
jgi:hypothetical protein